MKLVSLLSHSNIKPTSILRIVISGSIGVLVFWVFLVSKMDLPSDKNSLLAFSNTGKRVVELRKITEETQSIKTKPEEIQGHQIPMLQNAFTTFFVMVTILGGIWLWVRKKRKKVDHRDQTIKVITQHVIDSGTKLKIIEINNETWVLGITTNAVNLLHRYSKQDWHPSKASNFDSNEAPTNNFNSILKLFRN
jgi:flagellar biogenesis protein FliO